MRIISSAIRGGRNSTGINRSIPRSSRTETIGPPAPRPLAISAWLVSVLREYRANSGGVGLVFPSTAGTPLNTANVRSRMWMPLLERAQVRYRDMYSLRWTFVSLARASGEAAFNVSRLIGHARSTIVDTIYGHPVDSALAEVSESVANW